MVFMNERLKMFNTQPRAIPEQKLPGWIRWPLRILAYPFMMLEILSNKIVSTIVKPKYKIVGGCKKSGNCCRYIHLGWPKNRKLNLFSKLYVLWQTEVLGFYFKDFDFVEDQEVTKVMGCRYLKEDGSCKHYRLRPGICRNWPKIHYFREPTILKGCGFKAVKRDE